MHQKGDERKSSMAITGICSPVFSEDPDWVESFGNGNGPS